MSTFEKVLEATGRPIYAELKAVEADGPLAASTLEQRLAGRVVPVSFHPEVLRQTKLSLPDLPVGLILCTASPNPAAGARSVDATFISLEVAYLDEATVERCQRAGLRVTTWMVNEPEEMRRALATGVDGIATDRPDLLAGLAAH